MNKKQIVKYLEYRIECAEAFLHDVYTLRPDIKEVFPAHIERNVLKDVIKYITDPINKGDFKE